MATLLLLCLFFYFSSVFYIRSTSAAACTSRDDADLNGDAGSRVRQQRYHAALFARLALIMGAAWAIAFLGTFMPYEEIDSVVNALVGLQGAYLFFAFKDYRYLCSSMSNRLKSMPSLQQQPQDIEHGRLFEKIPALQVEASQSVT
ncbi:hypothetical protein HPB52_009606 [Rhipicephalus sanguineus]|uniref:Uncharacterized protein n=1 Tax=Rhipicephalus sanguineus TaxID=34632 RepID=A0A9D4PJV2_RHISA|nr:hypothetical protein HPB52_009606 [Rhipicephalus sanguineus]